MAAASSGPSGPGFPHRIGPRCCSSEKLPGPPCAALAMRIASSAAALHDAEQRLLLPAVRGPGLGLGPAGGALGRQRRTTSGVAGRAGHTSSTIWMSAPSSSRVLPLSG